MNKTDQVDLSLKLGRILEDLINRGFKLPFTCVTISCNGSVTVGRYQSSITGTGLDTEIIFDSGKFSKTPVNLIFVDSEGKAARTVIGKDSSESSLQYLN